jgi:enoyl-CoA hydratase/carnithine racemase
MMVSWNYRRGLILDNPPINLFDPVMINEFTRLLSEARSDGQIRVLVFESANPDFFIGHADLNLFLGPRESIPPKPNKLNPLQTLFEDLRTLPQATIGILEGRAVGGGAEFLLNCDMVFAARGRAVLSMFETAVCCVPAATGSQRLPKAMGRSRALEVILGCDEFDADLAERYNFVNRSFDPDDLHPFVDRLATRIACFPAQAIAVNKVAVDAAELPTPLGLFEETHGLDQVLVSGEAQRRMAALLAMGAQTVEFEQHRFSDALERLGNA